MLKNIFCFGLVTASLFFFAPAFADDNGTPDQQDDDATTSEQLHDGERSQQLSDQEQKAIEQAQEQFNQTQNDLHTNQTQQSQTDIANTLRAQVAQDKFNMEQNLRAGKNVEANEDAARLTRDEKLLKEAEANEYRSEGNLNEYHEPHQEVAPRQFSANPSPPLQQPTDPAAGPQDGNNLQQYQVSPNNSDPSAATTWE